MAPRGKETHNSTLPSLPHKFHNAHPVEICSYVGQCIFNPFSEERSGGLVYFFLGGGGFPALLFQTIDFNLIQTEALVKFYFKVFNTIIRDQNAAISRGGNSNTTLC